MKLEKTVADILIEKRNKLINEEKRNVLNRYCRKVEYYTNIGMALKDAQLKAKRYYKFIK